MSVFVLAPDASSTVALGAHHPQLLFERGGDSDEEILRDGVDAGRPTDAPARASGHVGDAGHHRLDDRVIAEDTGGERLDLACGGDRVSPTVGRGADRHGAFGYLVAEGMPGVDELVEREVKIDRN